MAEDLISLYRARLAAERGTIHKDWGGKVSIALAYPSHYRLGMSNLGFQVVYGLLNSRPDVVAERVFLPEGQEASLYLHSGKPLLSLESQRGLQDFQIIAFSLSFENDYPNVLKMLEMGRIPVLGQARSAPLPYVMAGGVTTFLNPEPLASFMDFFLLGEAEANLNAFVDLFLQEAAGPADRKTVLKRLAKGMRSLYVPALYEPEYHRDGPLKSFRPKEAHVPPTVEPACAPVEAGEAVPVTLVTTPETEFGDRVLVEMGRGCGRACRFCAAGYVYRPPRFREPGDLAESIEGALGRTYQVGLLGTAVSDHPHLGPLAAGIVEKGCGFSLSSLRADSLTPDLLENLKRAGQRTLAIAPEAGSERLRAVINKHLTRDQLTEAVRLIARTGDFSIRLYFLIGLPTETREDAEAIVDLVKVLRHHMVKESAPRGSIGRIRLSVNCFVPKAFTPFQWFPMTDIPQLKERQKWLRKRLTREGGVRVNMDMPKWAYVQTLLSMGDRRAGAILHRAHEAGGDWTRALRHSDVNPDFFVYRPRGLEEVLPWDFVDQGISKGFLASEYKRALEGKETDGCDVGACFRCGVCRPETET